MGRRRRVLTRIYVQSVEAILASKNHSVSSNYSTEVCYFYDNINFYLLITDAKLLRLVPSDAS